MRREIGAHHAVTHTPTSHRIRLRKSIQQNRPLLHSIDRHDGMMFALENKPAVNLIAQHHDVSIADRARDTFDVDLSEHAAGRILWRIQND